MWGFIHKPGGPLGARNREQTLPTPKECWALREIPTPGSAPSKVVKSLTGTSQHSKEPAGAGKRPGSSGSVRSVRSGAGLSRPENSRDAGVALMPIGSTAEVPGEAVPRNATMLKDQWLKDPARCGNSGEDADATAGGERRVAFRTRSLYQQQEHELMTSHSAPLLMTSHGTLLADDTERKMPPLCRTRGGARCGSDSRKALRRHRTELCRGPSAVAVVGAGAGNCAEEGPPRQGPPQPSPARRLLGLGGGMDRPDGGRERNGGNAVLARSTTPARVRQGGGPIHHTGAAAALEGDMKYQETLMIEWKKSFGSSQKLDVVQKKQLCQFFDFLAESSKDVLGPSANHYIKEAMLIGDIDSLEANMRKSAPEVDSHDGMDFTTKQKEQVRSVLKGFAQASRPYNRLGDVIFRPTFCRFLIDSGLVSLEEPNVTGYHEAVRLFDCIARQNLDASEKGKSLAFGATRCATVDQCISVVSQLLGLQDVARAARQNGLVGTNETWNNFEEGLERSQRIVQAILNEGKRRAQEQARLAEEGMTDEAIIRRRKEVYETFGSPPTFFCGSLRDWSRGLKYWVDSAIQTCAPETSSDHSQTSFSVECFLRDMLLEPGIIHVVAKFSDVFKTLFEGYHDETRSRFVEDGLTGKPKDVPIQHMSFACFFRFCVDFSIFPGLCSFDEVWGAYRNADSMVPVCGPDMSCGDKWRRACRRASILSVLESHLAPGKVSSPSSMASESSQASDDDGEKEDSAGMRILIGSKSEDQSVKKDNSDPKDATKSKTGPEVPLSSLSRRGSFANKDKEFAAALGSIASRRPSQGPGILQAAAAALARRPSQVGAGQLQVPTKLDESPSVPGKQRGRVPSTRGLPGNRSEGDAGEHGGAGAGSKSRTHVHREAIRGSAAAAMMRTNSIDQISNSDNASRRHSKVKVGPPNHPPHHGTLQDSPQLLKSPRSGEVSRYNSMRPESGVSNTSSMSLGSQVTESPPRVKVCCDFTWLKQPFSKMSEKDLNHYSVLCALHECVVDRFMNVRGLVKASGQQLNKQGLLTVQAVRNFLEWLRVAHPLAENEELEDFIRSIDPNSDGLLDPAELEKAVESVRSDLRRRRLLDTDKSGCMSSGGKLFLAEESRRLSHKATRFGDPNIGEVKAAFGEAAFVEALLLLGIQHMHSDGKAIKGSAPGGVKGLWLVAFLHCRFDQHIRDLQSKKSLEAMQKREVAEPAPPEKPRELLERKSDPINDLPAMAKSMTMGPLLHKGLLSNMEPLSEASTRPQTRDEPSRPQTRDADSLLPPSRQRGREGGGGGAGGGGDDRSSPVAAWSGERDSSTSSKEKEKEKDKDKDSEQPRAMTRESSIGPPMVPTPSSKKSRRVSVFKAASVAHLALAAIGDPSSEESKEKQQKEREKEKEKEKARPTSGFLEPAPKRASYTSYLQRLVETHPDVFVRTGTPSMMYEADGSSSSTASTANDKTPTVEVCDVCGTKRETTQVGSVFCHKCSGVDFKPLKDSVLYPVFERRRMRWELKDVKAAMEYQSSADGPFPNQSYTSEGVQSPSGGMQDGRVSPSRGSSKNQKVTSP